MSLHCGNSKTQKAGVQNARYRNGEPVNIGRKSRLWPAAMARAIKDRDQHCQFPGYTHTQNLQIHHIQHWADNGMPAMTRALAHSKQMSNDLDAPRS